MSTMPFRQGGQNKRTESTDETICSCNLRYTQVDKYDDPNTAVNKLMLALTGMGFDLNFPANRLKQVGLSSVTERKEI